MEQTTFYPAVNSIINTGRLPDPIKDIINSVGSKWLHLMNIVVRNKIGSDMLLGVGH